MKLKFASRFLLSLSLSVPAYASTNKTFTPEDLQELIEMGLIEIDGADEDSYESEMDPSLQEEIEKSVIKIHVKFHEYDFSSPWKAPDQNASSGTGFVIEGNRILTNAHVIADAAFIQVSRSDRPKKYYAEVEYTGHDCDLAIIRVKDSSFFDGLSPLEFGGLPEKRAIVETYGYPSGGESLSITKGTISRTEVQAYCHTGYELLCSQTDAAINPGNSGGPVISEDGLVVGVAFQGIDELQNTGYLIPVPVIRHFLDDIKSGKYQGFPELGVDFQELESSSLRRKHGLSEDQHGILVTHIQRTSPAKSFLEVGDIVVSIDDKNIDRDMKFNLTNSLRVLYSHIIRDKQVGEKASFGILRKGEPMTVEVPLPYAWQQFELIPSISYDKKPTYYIYGGCVFQPLTANCFGSVLSVDVLTMLSREKKAVDQELVVLNRVLAAEVNDGYHEFNAKIVDQVNGEKVRNLRHLIELLEKNEGEYQEITFSDHTQMVLDRQMAIKTGNDILDSYSIASERSNDLRK